MSDDAAMKTASTTWDNSANKTTDDDDTARERSCEGKGQRRWEERETGRDREGGKGRGSGGLQQVTQFII